MGLWTRTRTEGHSPRVSIGIVVAVEAPIIQAAKEASMSREQ